VNWKKWLRTQWDRVGAWLCIAAGVVTLIAGWVGAAATEYPAEQLPFIISGGIGGALLVALGCTLLISADMRDEWQKLDRIEKVLGGRPPGP
jgi:putative Mn2+ efflux pump MntP